MLISEGYEKIRRSVTFARGCEISIHSPPDGKIRAAPIPNGPQLKF